MTADKQTWRSDEPCTFCGVRGCDCGCPTCRAAEAERAAGARSDDNDLRIALAEAMKQRPDDT